MRRRGFVATAAGLGTAALAGCSGGGGDGGDGTDTGGTDTGGTDTDTDGGDGDGGGSTLGAFRLLVSDQPAAIGDFDSLDVTLSTARVFRAEADETVTPAAVNATATSTSTPATETEADDDEDAENEDDGESRGYVEFDLDGVTVDLTQVVGDRAVSVLQAELEAGRYSGIELRVESVEGVVDGESVDVMVPSDRLRIVRPFEIAADEELGFVFDINVVRKGPRGGYNLLPVIGKSGVAGEDVEVREVDADGSDEDDEESTETPAPDEESTETPDPEGSDMANGGSNETAT